MKYIDKTKTESEKAKIALHDWRDNYIFNYENGITFKKKKKEIESEQAFLTWFEEYKAKSKNIDGRVFDDFCKELDAKTAWLLIDEYGGSLKQQLRIALFEEQEKICCYCCQEIETDKTKIEHFVARSHANEDGICKKTYNYENLLLSCIGNEGKKGENINPKKDQHYAKGSTWEEVVESIRQRFSDLDNPIDIDTLKKMNPLQANQEKPKGQLIYELSPQHCDKYKSSKTDKIINPAALPDCWDKFSYHSNGTITGFDKLSRSTIEVLNLNAKVLEKKRANIWKELDEQFEPDPFVNKCLAEGDIQSLTNFIKSELDFEVGNNLTYPFCIVRRAFLKSKYEEYAKIQAN